MEPKSLWVGSWLIACYYYNDGIGWFRVFNKGLHWKNTDKHGLTFSERHGYKKTIKLGKWLISTLK